MSNSKSGLTENENIVKKFKESYKDFLNNVTKHTINSANKYVSYINKACRLPGMDGLWDKLATEQDAVIKTKYVEELCDAIIVAINNPCCAISEKDLRDCQSSAHVLLAFVSDQTWTKHKGITIRFTAIYNKKAVRSIFLSRLTTQDRIYDFGAFPINIIHGIANRKKIALFDKIIDEIKFVYDDEGSYYVFREIDRVFIANDNHAYFKKGGKIYPIFTQIPNTKPVKYVMALSPHIKELSLDHDIPIEKELRKAISAMPILKKLSTDIVRFKKTYIATHKGANNRVVLAEYKKCMMPVDEDSLIKEIELFINGLSLTIMQRNLNSSKSNRL